MHSVHPSSIQPYVTWGTPITCSCCSEEALGLEGDKGAAEAGAHWHEQQRAGTLQAAWVLVRHPGGQARAEEVEGERKVSASRTQVVKMIQNRTQGGKLCGCQESRAHRCK